MTLAHPRPANAYHGSSTYESNIDLIPTVALVAFGEPIELVESYRNHEEPTCISPRRVVASRGTLRSGTLS